jgi:eukaryotic-like serine/threonine-protein kinase
MTPEQDHLIDRVPQAFDAATLPPAPPPSESATLPPAPADSLLPETVGPVHVPGYEVLRELGRGGMGVVYQARHLQLGRVVALKMVLAGGHASAADLSRFRTEAEAVARLQHPNIVQIFEVGEYGGLPFFSLEYCDGGNLDRKLSGTPLPPKEAASLARTLARAMQAAHEKGVVHRDLKPANVLLTADGEPKITDFGLAKRLDDASGQTQTGVILGTPSYMAPEQAAGRAREVGPAADVYALGAILYELLTGRPPFRAATPLDTILQVAIDEAVPPRQLQRTVPRDLETVCLKCLGKEPRKRYASAQALADDLGRFLEGRPVAARPVGRLELVGRWCRRNPVVAGLTATLFLSLAAGAGVASWFAVQAAGEARRARADEQQVRDQADRLNDQAGVLRDQADELRDRADKLRDESLSVRRNLYDAQMSRVQLTWEEGQPELIPPLLDGQRPEQTGGADLRGFEWHFWSHRRRPEVVNFNANLGQLEADATDGRRVAVAAAAAGVVWEVGAGRKVCGFTAPTARDRFSGQELALSPDGRFLAAGGEWQGQGQPKGAAGPKDFSLHLWDAATGAALPPLEGHTGRVAALAFSDDGRLLASASRDGTARTWDPAAGKQLQAFEWPDKKPPTGGAVAFEPGGRRLVWAADGRVIFWDLATGAAALSYPADCRSLAFSPDGRKLAVLSEVGIRVLDAAKGRETAALQGNCRGVRSFTFSPDGKRIATAHFLEGRLRVWDAHTGEELVAVRAGEGMHRVAFSADGRQLIGVGQYRIHVWDAATDPGVCAAFRGSGLLAISADGTRLASVDLGDTVHVWDVPGRREERTIKGSHTNGTLASPALRATFSPDGRRLAVEYRDGQIQVWNVADGRTLFTLHTPEANPTLPGALKPRALRYSPDGSQLLWAWCGLTGECEAGACDAETGAEVWHTTLPRGRRETGCPAISPDGLLLAVSGADPLFHVNVVTNNGNPLPGQDSSPVRVYSAQDGKLLFTADAPADFLTFSADGRLLAGGHHGDRTVIVRDAQSGRRVHSFGGYQTPFVEAAFSPDGRRLAAVSADGVMRVWDLQTENEVLSLKGVTGVQFSADGRFLAAGGPDADMRVWDVGPGD